MDEQLPPGYFLQTTPAGGTWRLYDIREQGDCRICICEINVAGDNLDIQVLSGPYDAALEHWNAGVQEQLICTNRIIELLWQQEAPQAVSDQLAAWHREDEAREFASLQRSTTAAAFTAEDHERDFREWVDALNEQRDGEVEISAEERLSGGLDDFYAQEAEMERQLGAEAEAIWLDQWEVPDEPPEPEEPEDPGYDPNESATYDEYLDEVEPEMPSYREWDDMDNFWNQEGVFEEMTDLYHHDEDY
jgi:hypothetical protein